ncbi:hypothetical protein ASPFODRAFT_64255 [Aspergillus luchuensis CBS 106.47]|uniref:Uncharacterized protein n=1 Tax=Aspergillus luchuensis (strain CBS 106.47) TaxID=1137211 RepID=A0A1M3T635_ASPLC|nr:hypothetical protein ASPFODRAFT_64255 [Aspergillus luchuensis CBS 106.47]
MAVDQEHTIWALCGITLFGNSRLGTLVHRGRHPATTFIKGISVSQPLLRVVIQQLGSRVLEMHQGTALRWRAAAVWRGGKESYRGKSSPPHLATISSLQRARRKISRFADDIGGNNAERRMPKGQAVKIRALLPCMYLAFLTNESLQSMLSSSAGTVLLLRDRTTMMARIQGVMLNQHRLKFASAIQPSI